MPDWKGEISRRLRGVKLAPAREAEILEEMSQHLEDRYKELVNNGRRRRKPIAWRSKS